MNLMLLSYIIILFVYGQKIPTPNGHGNVSDVLCHTPVLKSRTEASIRVHKIFKSHA
jgi:hypothetical protein